MRERFSPPFCQRRDDLDRPERVGGFTVTPHESTGYSPDTSRTRYTSRLHRSGRVKRLRSTSRAESRLARRVVLLHPMPYGGFVMSLLGVQGQDGLRASASSAS